MADHAAIVLAAGKGKRMKSMLPKPLHPLAGRPMVCHVLATVASTRPKRCVVVTAPAFAGAMAAAIGEVPVALQRRPLGTGHAVLAARETMAGFTGDVLVLFADTPLLRRETLRALLAARRSDGDAAVAVLGFRPRDPARYGRLVCDAAGRLEAIVEYDDADAAVRQIGLCNAGAMAVDGGILFALLDSIGSCNAQEEYYLTDIVAAARRAGRVARVVEADEDELMGVDTRAGLARAEAELQQRLRQAAMEGGATLVAPETVFLSHDTRLGRDVVVHPHVVFGPGVEVAAGAEIRSFSHLEGCRVAAGARIGPFARLRPEAEIGPDAHIGNFVEVKKARIEAGAKVNHLTYIGDARVGERANVGAGTITCNYDGFNKDFTDIGNDAFIGSNTALVAPVKVGDGAIIGAGSVITEEVPAEALALTRAPQKSIAGFAKGYRKRKAAQKAAGAKSGSSSKQA